MSTLVELAGFACAVIAATIIGGPAAGWAVAAGALVLTGYALEGSQLDLQGAVQRQREKRQVRKARRAAKKAAKAPTAPK